MNTNCNTIPKGVNGGMMATYADKPFQKLRVGIVGLGRGEAGTAAFNEIPGCEITAICDLNAVRIQRILAEDGGVLVEIGVVPIKRVPERRLASEH